MDEMDEINEHVKYMNKSNIYEFIWIRTLFTKSLQNFGSYNALILTSVQTSPANRLQCIAVNVTITFK